MLFGFFHLFSLRCHMFFCTGLSLGWSLNLSLILTLVLVRRKEAWKSGRLFLLFLFFLATVHSVSHNSRGNRQSKYANQSNSDWTSNEPEHVTSWIIWTVVLCRWGFSSVLIASSWIIQAMVWCVSCWTSLVLITCVWSLERDHFEVVVLEWIGHTEILIVSSFYWPVPLRARSISKAKTALWWNWSFNL